MILIKKENIILRKPKTEIQTNDYIHFMNKNIIKRITNHFYDKLFMAREL